MVKQALKGGIRVGVLFSVDRCGVESALLDVGFTVAVNLFDVDVVDTNSVRDGTLNAPGDASPQRLCVLSVSSSMQLCRVNVDLLVHRCVYVVSDMLLADDVVLVVVAAGKRRFVFEDGFVNDVGKVGRFDAALNTNRLVICSDGKFDSSVDRIVIRPTCVNLLNVGQHVR